MTNMKTTKKALIFSALSLLLCFSMLVGTTFAWFTDSVTSAGNIIQSGTLDVTMEWAEGTADPADVNWIDASRGAIFNNTLWEPGYTEVRHIKIANEGTLALKYEIVIEANGKVDEQFADVIDVYVIDPAAKIENRTELAGERPIGTLRDVLNNMRDLSSASLFAGDVKTFTIALKMRESAGNEYQGKQIGDNFSIKLLATQLTAESDSFDKNYDGDALICDVLATPATFGDILANAQPGDVIGLASGAYYEQIDIPCDNLTLVSNSAVVDSINLNGKNGVVIDGLTFEAFYGQIATSTYSSGKYALTGYVASITNTTSTAWGADDVTIKNCTFIAYEGAPAYGNYDSTKYVAIDFEDAGRKSGPSTNIAIENCTFKAYEDTDTNAADAVNWIRLNYVEGTVEIKNNKFLGATSHHNINASGNDADWIVSGNYFSNWADGEYAFGTSRSGSAGITTIEIIDNSFNKAMTSGEEIPVLSIKSSYTDANSEIIVKDNIANGGYADIDAERRADSKYYMTATATTVATKADLAAAINNANGDVVINANGANLGNLNYGINQSMVPAGKTVTIANADFSNNGASYGNKVDGTIIFENCIFDADVYSIHFDGGNGKVIFNNCTLVGWCSFGSVEVEMNNCTIEGNGTYAIVRCYKDAKFSDCVFDMSDTDTTDGYQDGIDMVAGATATVTGCTNVNGTVEELFEAEDIAGTDGTIIFN